MSRKVPRETDAAAAPVAAPSVAVVLPKGAVPGLKRRGTYAPGVVYHVDPDTAARLQARGFQLAAAAPDTAEPAAIADVGGGGNSIATKPDQEPSP